MLNSSEIMDELNTLEMLGSSEYTDDELDYLKSLAKFAQWGEENVSDWSYGVPLINENYFIDYITELVQEVYYEAFKAIEDLPDVLKANVEFDWDSIAEDFKADYVEYDFDGVTYYGQMA